MNKPKANDDRLRDTEQIRKDAHRAMGDLGSKLLEQSNNRLKLQRRRAKERAKRAQKEKENAKGRKHKAAATVSRRPTAPVQPAATVRNQRGQTLPAPTKKQVGAITVPQVVKAMKDVELGELRKLGLIILTEQRYKEVRNSDIVKAQEEMAKEATAKTIVALEASMAKLDMRKILRTFGLGQSLSVQKEAAKLTALNLFVEESAIEPANASEAEATARSHASDKHRGMRERLEAKISALDIAKEANALLLEEFTVNGEPQLEIDKAFAERVPPYAFWTKLARRPKIVAAFGNDNAAYVLDGARGMVLKESLQKLYGLHFLQNYRFAGSARTFEVTVDTAAGPVTHRVRQPNLTRGVATMDEAHKLGGGSLHVPQRVLDGRPCKQGDLTLENLQDPSNPFYQAFADKDVEEALPRAFGTHGDDPDDNLPTTQYGGWMKATTPNLTEQAADGDQKERGFRLIKTRHPEEAARTRVGRMAGNGALNKDAIRSGKTLRIKAVLCPDHESYGDRSCGVLQVVFYAGDDEETQSFFDEVDREKVQKSMMAESYPLYNLVGLAEAKDGYKSIEAPLTGIIRRLLFKKTFAVKGPDGIDFNVIIDHVGCGSLTADEKARILELNRKGGGADVFSFADVVSSGYMDYEHLSTSKVLDVQYIYDMMLDFRSTENIETDDTVFKEWIKKYPGFEGPCWQLTGNETQEEIEQMFGSLKSPVGVAKRTLFCAAAIPLLPCPGAPTISETLLHRRCS